MANIKDTVDKFSNAKDIAERQQIIYDYRTYGKIDRTNTINKIIELRTTNEQVAMAQWIACASQPSIPIEQATDEQLINELEKQIAILTISDTIQGANL
jgi:hypothetical protein